MEQPLGPHSACLLGSFNMTKYVSTGPNGPFFDFQLFVRDIPIVIRAMDIVNDISVFPLEQQRIEAQNKRRLGIGVTGMANAIEFLGHPYASSMYISLQNTILEALKEVAYQASAYLAKEKGPFPAYNRVDYLYGPFVSSLSPLTRNLISEYGIRNSHLISIAPTGTISLCADNISSGIEPVFSHTYNRTIQTFDGPIVEEVKDYAFSKWGVVGKTANECSVQDHVAVLANAQKHSDSAVSKTCNVGERVTFEEFKDVYMDAYKKGCKGITTFRASGKRYGILNESPKVEAPGLNNDGEKDVVSGAEACYIDPTTGKKSCE